MTAIIGIDAEWQRGEDANSVLSYQWFGLDGEREWADLYLPNLASPEHAKRLTLSQWLSKALQQGYRNTQWPNRVVLASHFTTAELSVVRDFPNIKRRVDLIQGSSFASARQPFTLTCYDKSRNGHAITVHLLDTMLLAPDDSKSLANLGSLLGYEKLELPHDHKKDEMRRFLDDCPELFKEYAIRDAEITARYIRRIERECTDLGLDGYRPVTIGGLAQRILTHRLEEEGRPYDVVMGVDQTRVRQGGYTNRERRYENRIAERHEDLAIKAYHGGRNECFLFGFFDETFTDYDLEGAYSTALAAVKEPDFDNLLETKNPDDFKLDQMGYALVSWKFPQSTRFPCLFQRDPKGHGLIYLLEGEEYLTSPEIALAIRMGADITIRTGIVVPAIEDGYRPFLGISQWVNSQRKQFPKHTHPFENAFYKLIGNNVYGKVAQGLKNTSRVFDSRTGNTQALERSRISDAYAAAYTTGLVRATTSEILSRLTDDVLVGNTITDGVCTTASKEQMAIATSGPQCQFFSSLRDMICSDPKILDIKGKVEGMVFMRTRMHATTGEVLSGSTPILAKVNVPMSHLKTEDDENLSEQEKNNILIEEFLNREWDREWKSRSLTTARKVYDRDGDLLEDETSKFLGMDYDFKRKPHNPETQRQHLRFETSPWLDHAEFAKCRSVFDTFKEPIKSEQDLEIFFQALDTKGNAKSRTRGKRRKDVFVKDIMNRMAVGDDGLVDEHGEKLKPKEIDKFIRELTEDELGASGDQIRKARSRIMSGDQNLEDGWIEVTSTVSALDQKVGVYFVEYSGKSLKKKSSKRIIPKK